MASKAIPAVVHCLRKLNAFNPVRRALRDSNVTANNWEALQGTLQSKWNPHLERVLVKLYTDLSLHGRKSIVLYDLPEHARKRLLSLKNLPFAPIPIIPEPSENQLPELVTVLDNDDERLFVFWSCRHLRREQKIDLSTFEKGLPENLRDLDELWGFRYEREAAIDVVAIPRNDRRAEIRVHQSVSHKRMHPSEEDIRSNLLMKMRHITDGRTTLGQQINVFPAISQIYKSTDEGRIIGLEFWCPTAARRHEHLPIKTEGDLRKEKYHEAGVRAVNKMIEIYSLQVQWDEDQDEESLIDARLDLDGSPIALEQKHLSTVSVPCLVGKNELEYMLRRLASYV